MKSPVDAGESALIAEEHPLAIKRKKPELNGGVL
jgi:hypothetical protein